MFVINRCVFVFMFTVAHADHWSKQSGQANEYSYLQDEYSDKDGIYFSSTDLYRMRKVLPYLPIRGTPLEPLLEYAQSCEGMDLDINFEEARITNKELFVQSLLNDADFLTSNRAFSASGGRYVDNDDIPDPEERNQTKGWEGCRRDYDTVMLPVTQEYARTAILIFNDQSALVDLDVPEVPEALNVTGHMIEALARRPAGFTQGAIQWVGVPEICGQHGIRYTWNNTEVRHFKGKYVRINMPLETSQLPTVWPLAIGICAPDTCEDEHIVRYVTEENVWMIPYLTDSMLPRNITLIYSGQKIDFATDPAAKGVIAYLIILVVLALIATCYDGWGRQREIRKHIKRNIGGDSSEDLTPQDLRESQSFLYGSPSFRERFETGFAGFSFYTNLRHIYTVRESVDRIPCLDGIKAISYLWITKGMSYIYGVVYFETWTSLNLLDAITKYFAEWQTMVLISMPYANSTLFFCSGFLCVHLFYKAFKRNNEHFTFWFLLRFFIHRFWSLAPSIMGILVVYTWYYRYLGDGPMSSPNVSDAEKCKETWWLAGLMFNNLFKLEKQCFAWDWYIGCVWQLHLVSIFIVAPLVLLPAVGYVMVGLMYIAHIVVLGIWQKRNYDDDGVDWYWDILQTPWCSAGPYAIGMMFAMIMKNSDRKKKWHWAAVLVPWIGAVTGIMTVIYAPWDQLKEEPREWTRTGQITFNILAPQIMALSVGWITLATWKGYGGVVGNLLNWQFFNFMSKMLLPLTVFMGPVMQKYSLGRRVPFYIHEVHMSQFHYGHLITVFLFANLIALMFTYPVSRGIIHAVRSKTRLELYLWARHPDILTPLTGDPELDEPRLDRMDGRQSKPRTSSHKYITGDKIRDVRHTPPPPYSGGESGYVPSVPIKQDLGHFHNDAYEAPEEIMRL